MNSSRREALITLLGLPAFLATSQSACSRRRLPPGEIAGADHSLGHILREQRPTVGTQTESIPVLIVGAGLAGLSAAWRLSASSSTRFSVVELEKQAGGTSRSARNSVSSFPWGGHYVPAPMKSNRVLVRLLTEMGVVVGTDATGEPIIAEEVLVAEPEERLFYRGTWHEGLMPADALTEVDNAQMAMFRAEIDKWVAFRDDAGRRGFSLPVASCSDVPQLRALDSLSMAEWMNRCGLSSPRLRWYVDYACRDDYGCTIDTASAWAGLFYFASRIRKPGISAEPLLSWPEGNGRIVNHLHDRVAASMVTQTLAFDVIPEENGVRVLVMDGATRQTRAILAEHVVLAVPRFIAHKIVRPWREKAPLGAGEFETSPWLVANITLREHPASNGFGLAWDNVIYASRSLGYVVATHQRGRPFGPTVFTYYYALTDADPRLAREKLLSATRDEWVEVIVRDLEQAHPDLSGLIERIDIQRWGHAMVRPRVGFVWSEARRQAMYPAFGRVHFACTDLSGVALLEEAQYHGVRAAEDIIRVREGTVDSWL